MVAPVRSNRVAFRRAVFASVAIHVALAVAIVLVLRQQPEPKLSAPGLDTAASDITMRFFADEVVVAAKPPDAPPPSPSSESVEPVEGTSGSRPPLAVTVPHALPPEVLAIIRRPGTDPSVKQASAQAVSPIHGAMKPGQTVVYVIDCSGSMGEFGKLALARAALLATLRGQPEGVRFQVIAYNNSARVVSGAGTISATPANVAAAETSVLALESTGRSNHAAAVRLAVQARPDVILLLTDADDLALAPLKAALAGANKPMALYAAKVAATGIQSPQELR